MSGRRLRIKAPVNLGTKRKSGTKSTNEIKVEPKLEIDANKQETSSNVVVVTEHEGDVISVPMPIHDLDLKSEHLALDVEKSEQTFKCPPSLEYKKTVHEEDISSNNFEENVLKLDLQKSVYNTCPSPTKSRQRIKATPIFGTRRNSLVGSSSPFQCEEDQQKPLVCSTNNTSHLNTKALHGGGGRVRTESESGGAIAGRIRNESGGYGRIRTESGGFGRIRTESGGLGRIRTESGGYGRIRTESGCSAFSDSYAPYKPRRAGHDDHRAISKREFHLKFNGSVPEKSSLKMFDLIYYNPANNPMVSNPPPSTPLASDFIVESKITEEEDSDKEPEPPILVPQLKLGLNGEMMIDEKSLEIETTAEKEAKKVLANTSLIVLDENSGNNGFYKRQKRTKEWPPEETMKFYMCLQTIGTDFSMMLSHFPKRTRRELKLKFKKEEKCNAHLINKALSNPKRFNIEELQKKLDRFEEECLAKEARWKEIQSRQGVRGSEKKVFTSKAARCLKDGDAVYSNEMVPKQNLGTRSLKKAPRKTNKLKEPKKELDIDEQKAFDLLMNDEYDTNSQTDSRLTHSVIESLHSETVDSVLSNSTEMHNIESILTAINNNLLAIVASDDVSGEQKPTYEIYALDRETRELGAMPLSLPDDIVNLIVTAMES